MPGKKYWQERTTTWLSTTLKNRVSYCENEDFQRELFLLHPETKLNCGHVPLLRPIEDYERQKHQKQSSLLHNREAQVKVYSNSYQETLHLIYRQLFCFVVLKIAAG